MGLGKNCHRVAGKEYHTGLPSRKSNLAILGSHYPETGKLHAQSMVFPGRDTIVILWFIIAYDRVKLVGIDFAYHVLMREVEAGFLMLMVCGALYLQSDPMIWNNLIRFVVRIVG
jgi:hypothetical protein